MNPFDDIPNAKQAWSYLNLIGHDKHWRATRKPRVVTSSTNVNPLDHWHLVDCSGGAVTLTLYPNAGRDDNEHVFKKTDSTANAMTVLPYGSETIDLAASVATTVQGITFILDAKGTTDWASVILQSGAAVGGAGTVTSVALTVPAEFSVSGSPITTSGTLGVTKATQSANIVWAGPTSGAAAQPAFRALVVADLANDLVTYAKIQNVSATDRLLGRDTAAAGDIEELTVGGGIEFTGSVGIQTSAFTGDVTKSAGGTVTTIANDAVTYAKMQNISAASRVLGRGSASGSGDTQELTAAGAVYFDGTALTGKCFGQYLLGDQTTAITTGTKLTLRWRGCTLLEVFTFLATSGTGATTFDMKDDGTSVFSTKPSIDSTETSSTTGTAAVISNPTIGDHSEMTMILDAVGTGAKGFGFNFTFVPSV